MRDNQILINNLSKVYDNGFNALKNINLKIRKGEIFAMLGPNGAGKTTLISIICGIVNPTSGNVSVDDYDIIKDYRETRSRIGLVPQELTLEQFETVFNNVSYSRGLYGKKADPNHIEKVLKQLSLWDKKDLKLRQLSGGMKRRVLIAKALSHEPTILFLDEPTAGVDVELRKEMWQVVENLRKTGVTIILTTHYIEEAEAIADRVGVINQGEIVVVDETKELLKKMGHKKLTIDLQEKINQIPTTLQKYNLSFTPDLMSLNYTYNVQAKQTGITNLLQDLKDAGLKLKDLKTEQSTLEKIFVNLVKEKMKINLYAFRAIYLHEMDRFRRTLTQSVLSPVLTTSLYFIVFGSVIGGYVEKIDGISYGSYIVPGLLMLTLLTQSISNTSFGIFFPKFNGTIYEILAAPISTLEVVLAFVGAGATKTLIVSIIIFITSLFFVDVQVKYPLLMIFLLILVAFTFALFGFLIGLISSDFEQMSIIPTLFVTPMVFLGGSLYSLDMLPSFWQTVTYFNPVVYLINGLRFSFYGVSDFNIWISIGTMFLFLSICITVVTVLLKKGYKIKS